MELVLPLHLIKHYPYDNHSSTLLLLSRPKIDILLGILRQLFFYTNGISRRYVPGNIYPHLNMNLFIYICFLIGRIFCVYVNIQGSPDKTFLAKLMSERNLIIKPLYSQLHKTETSKNFDLPLIGLQDFIILNLVRR